AAIARRIPHGRYVEAQGSYHEILMESDAIRALWWREFDALTSTVIPAEHRESRDPGVASPSPHVPSWSPGA
ncbi:MAG: alpha/beta hydrolase, partial [Caulobacteraceae bacterium]|nr:alpha/beta hydrolase [Caulobacteraceae bacterium]